MRDEIFMLPEISIVAGEYKTFSWRLLQEGNIPFDTEGCTGNFSVVSYSDKFGETLISKTLIFTTDKETVNSNVVSVDLSTADTIGMSGKYIYQLTILDAANKPEIPGHGILNIAHNINEDFLQTIN